jgi:putative DNA primase/helicase
MGTIELRSGVENPYDPKDYMTRKAGCAVAPPETPHPLWSSFLDRITDDDRELIGFLQRYIGYCLTGITTEHVFVFAYGTGANGKGTFINTIVKIFGGLRHDRGDEHLHL